MPLLRLVVHLSKAKKTHFYCLFLFFLVSSFIQETLHALVCSVCVLKQEKDQEKLVVSNGNFHILQYQQHIIPLSNYLMTMTFIRGYAKERALYVIN